MAYIGSLEYDLMRGSPAGPRYTGHTTSWPGRDYHIHRQVGIRSPEATMTTTKVCADATAAAAWMSGELNLVWSTVTIIDGHALTWYNCKIKHIRQRLIDVIHEATSKKLCRTQWIVQAGEQTG